MVSVYPKSIQKKTLIYFYMYGIFVFFYPAVLFLVLSACAQHNCPPNSRCLNISGTLQCPCNSGYDGDQCEPVNPCEDSDILCSPFANCSHTGPGTKLIICRRLVTCRTVRAKGRSVPEKGDQIFLIGYELITIIVSLNQISLLLHIYHWL